MKSTKKFISMVLVVLMLITCVSASFTVSASTNGELCDYYATNPNGKIGVQKTITVDGDASDWTDDMLIAQGAAWDVANHFKGGHENCVLDTYALYASWDNNNLYVGWQMVNTTDTWAREGDGPLSDGGRVLDVPLILALSVDPNSTSMSNKNTNGNPIWGQKMGLEFNQHVDHLFYMSGKPGLGTPAMFTAVDSKGNTDYNAGCLPFKNAGIEYKMAETNICSNIYGLNYSEDPEDVYSSDADWVDYKTFKGSSGKHNTKYDSFYEMKIPLSVLNIDASYLQNNGIGAMLVATRGESGLDCIPFDDTMLDNALDSYGSDASTSHEKDDVDTITSDFARIGNDGTKPTVPTTVKPTVAPTTAKPTVAPTTAKPTVAPTTAKPTVKPTVAPTTVQPTTAQPTVAPGSVLTVNATSNFFPYATQTYNEATKQLTVSYKLSSNFDVLNSEWTLTYDSSKLSFNKANLKGVMPNIANSVVNMPSAGTIKGVFTDISLYNFKTEKDFVTLTFDVIGTGKADVDLFVNVLGVAYLDSSYLPVEAYPVDFGVVNDITKVKGFETAKYTVKTAMTDSPIQPTVPAGKKLSVNATSNFFPTATQTYDEVNNKVTVTYMLSSSMDIINSEWTLKYDPTKLSFDKANLRTMMPYIPNEVVNEPVKGKIMGNCSDLGLYDFKSEKAFVTATFDVIGEGITNIDLFMNILGVAYLDSNYETHEAYVVDFGEIKDVTKLPGFGKEVYTTKTVLNDPRTDYVLGDVNGDGAINITDVSLIQKYLAKLATLNEHQKLAADVDKNGAVNITDATIIQKYIAEQIPSLN